VDGKMVSRGKSATVMGRPMADGPSGTGTIGYVSGSSAGLECASAVGE
jgi:hypothetical protein